MFLFMPSVKMQKKTSILGGLRPPMTPSMVLIWFKNKREGVVGETYGFPT